MIVDPPEAIFEDVLTHFDVVRRNGTSASCRCPAHEDHSPSLSVGLGDDAVVMTCHAGCGTDAVLAAATPPLALRDLFYERRNGHTDKPRFTEYPYHRADGSVAYTKVRREPGYDGQRRSFWTKPKNITEWLPYRLPEVVAAVEAGLPVYIAEGEKDVDALVAAGVVATCNPNGAGQWVQVADTAAEALTAADVVIVVDRDGPGYAHGRDVARLLVRRARSLRIVEAAIGKDAADHLGAGRTLDELVVLAEAHEGLFGPTDWSAIERWIAEVDEPADDEQAQADEDLEANDDLVDSSFQPIDLGPVLAGDVRQPEPEILRRHDGMCLLYAGQVNGIHGDSGVGKGWVALLAVAQQLERGHDVLVVDAEDVATSIVARLRILGASDERIARHLVYVRPQAPFGFHAVDHLAELVTERSVRLVVVDSLGECFGLDGVDENVDGEVGPWLRRVLRRLANTGAAVLIVDHGTKAADNPLHPSGSKRKRAAIGGASYLVTPTVPLSSGKGGRLRLTCAKDRHGAYARGEHVADLVMTVAPTGSTVVELWPGGPSDEGIELPVELAARAAVEVVRAEGRPLSQNVLLGFMRDRIKASTEAKRGGIDLAVARGRLVETSAARGARTFTIAELDEDPHE